MTLGPPLRRRPVAPPLQQRARPPVLAPPPDATPITPDPEERNSDGWTRYELTQIEKLAAERYASLRKVDIEAAAEARAQLMYKATHGVNA